MSSKVSETSAGAQSIEEQAVGWFDRKTFWDWSESDENALQAWLAQSAAHEIAFWRLEGGWVRGERMSALKHAVARAPAAARRGLVRSIGRVAMGVMAVGVLAFGALAYLSRPQETTYATGLGEHRIIALNDGSKIELNTDSVLRIAANAKHRLVSLDRGEAFFEIKHDASRPFVVTAAGHRVTDLGTKFLLRLYNDRLTVVLTAGRARLEAKGPQSSTRAVLLLPGDMAVATASSLSLRKPSSENIAQILGWRRGLLLFDHATIAEAVAQFNRYNSRKLVVADAVAGRRTVTGTFQTNNIDDFTVLAHDVLGLHVQRLGQETVISR